MAITAEDLQVARSKLRRSPVRPELIDAKRRLKSKSEAYNIAKGKICPPGKKLSKNNKCIKTLRKKRVSPIKSKSKKRSIKRKSKKRSIKRKSKKRSIKRKSKKPSVKRRSKKSSIKRKSKKPSIKRKSKKPSIKRRLRKVTILQ
jgi:ATP-dependent RNA helicase DDX46/PRP5/arginine/serine-rich splicing factor 12